MPEWQECVAEAKIDDFDISGFADQYVFDLEISMYDIVSMTVIEGTGYLSTELARLLFLQSAVRNDVIEHLTTIDVFEEHIPVISRLYIVTHAADVRMIDQCNNGSFAGCSYFL